MDRALAITAAFDEAVGLCENAKKRQRWQGNQKVEHLGLTLPVGGDATASTQGSGYRPHATDGILSLMPSSGSSSFREGSRCAPALLPLA